MSPPNLRDLIGDIRAAVERYSREQLVEVLVYVFKQYVVEGPAPLAAGPVQLSDDLAAMSFAEVMRSLQLRLDLPELELFEVQGERVYVRAGGRSVPLEAASARAEPGPTASPPQSVPTPAPQGPAPPSTTRAAAPRTSVEEVTLSGAPGPRATPDPRSTERAASALASPRPVAAPAAAAAKPAEAGPAPATTTGNRLLEID